MNVSYFFLVWLLGIFKLHLGLHLWLTLYFYWTAQASCNVSYCFVTFIPNRMLTGLLFAGWSSRLVARVPESPPCSPHHLSATLAWAPSSGWASHTVLCTEPSYLSRCGSRDPTLGNLSHPVSLTPDCLSLVFRWYWFVSVFSHFTRCNLYCSSSVYCWYAWLSQCS